MNAKEAREQRENLVDSFVAGQGDGYLLAIEGPSAAKELFDSATQIEDLLEVPSMLGDSAKIVIQNAIDRFIKALAQYRKEIKL